MRKLLIALLLAGAVTLGGARPAQAHPWGWRGYWWGYLPPLRARLLGSVPAVVG
jgi:hypothetical protein